LALSPPTDPAPPRTYTLSLHDALPISTALRPIAESYGARGGTIRDPFGHRWFVQTAIEADDVPVEDVFGRRYGDIGYLTLLVAEDRKSTRLNSSHQIISYAVFCLKKKK